MITMPFSSSSFVNGLSMSVAPPHGCSESLCPVQVKDFRDPHIRGESLDRPSPRLHAHFLIQDWVSIQELNAANQFTVVPWRKQKTSTAILDKLRYPTDPARDNRKTASACFQIHHSSSFRPKRRAYKTVCCLHQGCNILLQSVKEDPGCQLELRA